MMQDMELEMMDVNERYRTLIRYKIQVSESEIQAALNIEKRWRQLYVDARTRDLRLVDTKAKFREVTKQQDVNFREELNVLRREFLDSGPGISSISLDDGVELLSDYKRRLNKLHKTKAELVNALNLFSLDVKPYPMLQSTGADVEQLDKIYGLYVSFKEFQQTMASMLWGDLDIQALQKGDR